MRIYVVCDLEGTCGVVNHQQQGQFDGPGYLLARRLATLELNALVEGALEGGATEVVAWDGHGNFPGGIDVELLHPECALIMNAGDGGPVLLERGWEALFFCGLHAMADAEYGVQDHSFWPGIAACWLNGQPIGEIGMSMATAGALGIPAVFLAGDKAAAAEARALAPDMVKAVVKEGLAPRGGFNGPALCLSPATARRVIRDGARRALGSIAAARPWRVEPPYTLRTRFRSAEFADGRMGQDGSVTRIDAFIVESTGDDLARL